MNALNYRFISITADSELFEAVPINLTVSFIQQNHVK